jgi:hypothetical protein
LTGKAQEENEDSDDEDEDEDDDANGRVIKRVTDKHKAQSTPMLIHTECCGIYLSIHIKCCQIYSYPHSEFDLFDHSCMYS